MSGSLVFICSNPFLIPPANPMDQNSPGNRPLFSIITVTYNAADTLPVTIESVRQQTCNLYEHLIIDGDSSDGTIEIARLNLHPLMRFRSATDRGIYDAMNMSCRSHRRLRNFSQCRRHIPFARHAATHRRHHYVRGLPGRGLRPDRHS